MSPRVVFVGSHGSRSRTLSASNTSATIPSLTTNGDCGRNAAMTSRPSCGAAVGDDIRTVLPAGTVGPGDDLEVVAAGITEIDATAAVIVVDLARPTALRVGPVLHAAVANAAVYRVKVGLRDQECVVLRSHIIPAVDEIKACPVIKLDDQERAERLGGRQAEQFGEEC